MKVEKIILNGCSFVHGFDICYERHGIISHTNWPMASNQMTTEQREEFNSLRLSGRLGELFDCEVVDLSWAGESNNYIAQSTIKYINDNINNINPENTLVITGWSEPQRMPFYLNDQKLNVCIALVRAYIKVCEIEYPRTPESLNRQNLYKKFLGMQEIWDENESMAYTAYFNHCALAFMLQQYLENKKIKHCNFNSLKTWPLKPGYLDTIGFNESYDDLINWTNWYPNRNISSYDWNWENDMTDRSIVKTDSFHPSLEAVDIFSKELTEFIKKNY